MNHHLLYLHCQLKRKERRRESLQLTFYKSRIIIIELSILFLYKTPAINLGMFLG